jgi:uncharacterized protein YndB with AHSA1/START domain
MRTLNYSILINAPKEKVWKVMLAKSTYEQWTKPFNPTSTFKGDWSQNSKMIFLGTDPKTGEEGGMVSLIHENRTNDFLSLKHIGEIKDGEEKFWKQQKHCFENYTLVDKGSGTEVHIEMTDIDAKWIDWMNELWPKALEILKKLSERK